MHLDFYTLSILLCQLIINPII